MIMVIAESINLVFPHLLSTVITLVVVLSVIWVFIAVRSKAKELDVLEQRIPDAARYEDLSRRLEEAEDEWNLWQDEMTEAKSAIAEAKRAKEWLEENGLRVQEMEANEAQARKIETELEEMQRRYNEQLERDSDLRKEHERLSFEVDRFQKQAEELEPKVSSLQQQHANLERDVGNLIGERDKLERDLKEQKQRIDELHEESNRLAHVRDGFNHEIGELRNTKTNLAGQVAGLEHDVEVLLGQTGRRQEGLEDLWKPVLRPDHFSDYSLADEGDSLSRVRDYLKASGLYFSDRALLAFHTSLKVSELSPIVVLAGLSGTGKSELPRRYAEAIGMHFLNLAVQPRWDSPQDMFGFYNYMEARYRATELSRALVQMDPYFEREGRGWQYPDEWKPFSLCSQLLLVLLDEMNLARVEYYFSEFLSRLEMRRGIKDPDNDNHRRIAEIPLEVRAGSDSDSFLHLWVGGNVLFVGTMNEDETTQTLSDKVVDRANVIRFGRPKKLSRERYSEPQNPSELALSAEQWQAWIVPPENLDPVTSGQVDDWIERLNRIMDGIRRPFAYRTHQGMRAYVANYPLRGHGVQWAMADQIEQKILPKFRGLDPNDSVVAESIEELCRLVEELNDEQLVAAIEQSKGTGEHLFTWQGVDRYEADGD